MGNLVGLLFALVVLSTTVIAFPLLLDRDVGAYEAVRTSARAVLVNPLQMIAWGIIVAALLALGTIPLFAGLAVVIPVLGHATWHLYRKVVEPAPRQQRLLEGVRPASALRQTEAGSPSRPDVTAEDGSRAGQGDDGRGVQKPSAQPSLRGSEPPDTMPRA